MHKDWHLRAESMAPRNWRGSNDDGRLDFGRSTTPLDSDYSIESVTSLAIESTRSQSISGDVQKIVPISIISSYRYIFGAARLILYIAAARFSQLRYTILARE